jgi:hypothetical protein
MIRKSLRSKTKRIRKMKQRRQRTRRLRLRLRLRLRKYSGGGTIPNTNPSLEDLQRQGAVFANPEKVDDSRDEAVIKVQA